MFSHLQGVTIVLSTMFSHLQGVTSSLYLPCLATYKATFHAIERGPHLVVMLIFSISSFHWKAQSPRALVPKSRSKLRGEDLQELLEGMDASAPSLGSPTSSVEITNVAYIRFDTYVYGGFLK